MKKFLEIAFAAVISTLFGITAANAHAQLVYSSPGVGQETHTAPKQVVLEFDGDLIDLHTDNRNVIQVTDSNGNRCDTGPSVLNGAQLTVQLNPITQPGTYTVSYLVISEDGHPVENSYQWVLLPKSEISSSTSTGSKAKTWKRATGKVTEIKESAKPSHEKSGKEANRVNESEHLQSQNLSWIWVLTGILLGLALIYVSIRIRFRSKPRQ